MPGRSRVPGPRPADVPAADPGGRLDPVRWPRPRRHALLRWSAVAVLLATAAALGWAPAAQRCGAAPTAPTPTAPTGTPPRPDGSGRPLAVPRGSVGVPVRLTDSAAVALLRPGDRVDLLTTGPDAPRRLATRALVLGVEQADSPTAGLFLAVTPDEARHAVGSPDARLAVVVQPPD